VTDYDDEELRRAAMRAGACVYVLKYNLLALVLLREAKGQRWQVNAMQKLIEFYEMVSLNEATLRGSEKTAILKARLALRIFERAMKSFKAISREVPSAHTRCRPPQNTASGWRHEAALTLVEDRIHGALMP